MAGNIESEIAGSAKPWHRPELAARYESGRYPFEHALTKLVGGVFRDHVPEGASVVELCAGLGYLKKLVPPEYHGDYLSTDYWIQSLKAGQAAGRDLTIQRASVFQLPFEDNSVDCLVDLDGFDTLPHLPMALAQAHRVLRPGGTFIHLQVNQPEDFTIQADFPQGMIWFPPHREKAVPVSDMTGIDARVLKKLINGRTLDKSKSDILGEFLRDPRRAYESLLRASDPSTLSRGLHEILDALDVPKVVVPSLYDHLARKLEASAHQVGLTPVESGVRSASAETDRTSLHESSFLNLNVVQLNLGSIDGDIDIDLLVRDLDAVREEVTAQIFVARK